MAGKSDVRQMPRGNETAPQDKRTRERSSVEFPYGDLDDAIEVARAIHENAGTACSPDQLAAYMRQTTSSGAFRLKIATARVFGIVETERGLVALTPLGRRIVDAGQEKEARAVAFLKVPLYQAIFEKFKGHLLPPPAALEREMLGVGVSPKQTDKARQAFERSAEQAGFFSLGNDRLTIPTTGAKRPDAASLAKGGTPPTFHGGGAGFAGGGSGSGGGGDVDPIIRGLVERLPPPDSKWPLADRVRWLQTAANAFGLVYQPPENENGEITITVRSAGQ